MTSYDRSGTSASGDALIDSLSQRLREAENRRSDCERAHREALAQLRTAQNRPSEPTDHLHSRVRELDKKAALETVRCEELQLELASALRRSGRTIADIRAPNIPTASGQVTSGSTALWQPARPPAPATEIERIMAKIEQDNRILAELEHTRSTTQGVQSSGSSHALGDYHSSPTSSPHHSTLPNHAPISQSSTMPTLSTMHATSSQGYALPNSTSVNYAISHNPTSAYSNNPVSNYSTSNFPSTGSHNVTFANPVTGTLSSNLGQISSTLSGIQSTIPGLSSGLTNNMANMGLSSGLQSQLTNNLSSGTGALSGVLGNVQNTGLSSGLTSTLTGLPNSLTSGIGSNLTNPLSGLTNTNLSGLSSNLTSYGQGTYTNPLMSGGLAGTNAMNIKLKPLEEMELGAGRYTGRAATPVTPHHQQSWALDTLGGNYGIDSIGALNPGFVHSQARPMSRLPGGLDMDGRGHYLNGGAEGQVDMLDIPGKGRCCVYIARYNYDPPDVEAAEGELSISAGDYLLVWGNGPEPGSAFLDAELLDGRRGLVPAQFVQRLIGDDLLEFHQAVVSTLRDADEGLLQSESSLPMDMSRLAELQEVGPEGPEDDDSVPAPRQLTLERQLNKSVLIGWTAPEPHAAGPAQIDSYHVYVDGVLKTTVKATERTRALVEGVDSNRPHRISVRSVTVNRRVSRDAACTMVIGRDTASLGPSCVKATGVTCSQAVISWLPANSNHQHVVCVNNVEVRTVKPGVYRHTITGLAPSTQYRVTVRAKHLRAGPPPGAPVEEAPGAYTDFRTLPKGLPDPPVDIMVEAGPQDGTLLVTWQPVGRPPAAGPVTGYAVYADGKKVTDVDSPTGDHALIDIGKLLGLNPKCVTVRTKSRDSQSSDSIATAIPPAVLRGVAARRGMQGQQQHQMGQQQRGMGQPGHMGQQHAGQHPQQRNQQMGHGHPHQAVLEHDENLSDKEIYPGSGQHHGHQQTSGFGTGLLKSIFDKITPGQGVQGSGIPAIEITKEAVGEAGALSGDELESAALHRSPHHAPQQHPPNQQMTNTFQQNQQGMRMGDQNRANNMRGGPMPNQPPGQYGPNRRQQTAGQQNLGPHQTPPQPHKRSRLFVALFDYDPATMSPNPDACDEELPFTEGDTIKVWGDKDADGFYWGECRGRRGYVPHNMVVETGDSGAGAGMDGGVDGTNRRAGDRWDQNVPLQNQTVKRMVALYDYDPQELSPNVDAEQVELSFHTGQTILVYGDMDDDGFYMGEIDGVRGLVPSNFLAEAPNDQYAQPMGAGRGAGRGVRGHGPGARGPPPPPRDNMGPLGAGPTTTNQQHTQQHQIQPPQPRQRKADACSLPPPQLEHHNNIATTHQDQLTQGRGRGRGIVGSNQPGVMQQGPGISTALQTQPSSLYTTPSSAYSSAQQQTQLSTPQGITNMNQQHNLNQQTMNQQGMNQQPMNQQGMNQQGMNQQGMNQQGMQNQQGIFASRAPMKGIPSVIPQSGLNPLNQMQQQPVTTQNQMPGAAGPNLMQKFSEMTAPGGDILSKGKELIFMKFGLGGK